MILKFKLIGDTNAHVDVDITIDSVTSDWTKPIENGDPVYITQTRSKDNTIAGFEYKGHVTSVEKVVDEVKTNFGHHTSVYKSILSHGHFVNL